MDIDELRYRVIGCAMEVHKVLGGGFQEVIYQRSLAIELEKAGILFAREMEQEVYYKENKVGTRRADFIIDSRLMVELKALIKLEDINIIQAKNYLTAYGLEDGLLINFGGDSLEYKRIIRRKIV